ncbi:uncharacterized protein NPIL_364761 [Nephila pilipes]|uniref:Uncharacterized protein n=1 Tax=Nephila pilipes TaxID=299642 RepID=A0A8X6MM11_NEPPI|nr:uncharacterized protein NPIL_364761 [Nephila pilipes]
MPLKRPFLLSLKECVKKIDSEVTEIKQTFNTLHIPTEDEGNENEQPIYKTKCRNMRKNVNLLKRDCQKFHSLLKHRTDQRRSYFYDMEDLTFDVEDEVVNLERYLAKFAYEPLSYETSCESSVNESSQVESESPESDRSLTPELILPRMILGEKKIEELPKELNVEVSKEVSQPATPELKVCTSSEKERKPRNVLSSPLPYSSFDSVTKLGDVARRLEF